MLTAAERRRQLYLIRHQALNQARRSGPPITPIPTPADLP